MTEAAVEEGTKSTLTGSLKTKESSLVDSSTLWVTTGWTVEGTLTRPPVVSGPVHVELVAVDEEEGTVVVGGLSAEMKRERLDSSSVQPSSKD